jgi:hypothetical protein
MESDQMDTGHKESGKGLVVTTGSVEGATLERVTYLLMHLLVDWFTMETNPSKSSRAVRATVLW